MKGRQKILIVDDSKINRKLLINILGEEYDFIEAENGREAIREIETDVNIDIMLLDITMPDMDGFEVLERMNRFHWIGDIPVIMISAEDSHTAIEKAYDMGACDYICRPFSYKIVNKKVVNTLKLYENQKQLMHMLVEQIYEKEKNNNMMIEILSNAVEFRNNESGDHVRNIRIATDIILRQLLEVTDKYSLSESDVAMMVTASALHDIGKVSIPEEILNKPGKFTDEEYETMKSHSAIGASIIERMSGSEEEPFLCVAKEICRWHHERWDGRGYPDGLVGEEIPISAQVVAIADVYDALTSERSYKMAYDHTTAIKMIMSGECGAFNPMILDCLMQVESKLYHAFNNSIENELYKREAELLSKEIMQSEIMPFDSRVENAIVNLQEYVDFFASCNGGVQLEYDYISKTITLVDWNQPIQCRKSVLNYVKLNDVENVANIKEEDCERIEKAVSGTTPDNPECSLSIRKIVGGEYRWHNIKLRSIWSDDNPSHYVKVIGQISDATNTDASAFSLSTEADINAVDFASINVNTINRLKEIFDIVRFVDPTCFSVLEINDSGALQKNGERCAAFWDDNDHCLNCVSARAYEQKTTLNKLEFTATDIYCVISKYICINGTGCVMEMITKIDNGRWIDTNGKRFLIDRVENDLKEMFKDSLTDCYSRRYLDKFSKHLEGMKGVLFVDIDNFKNINDTYGHVVGDKVLCSIVEAIKGVIRSDDVMIRYGGDEFLLLFPEMSEEDVKTKTEQIQKAVNDIVIEGYPEIKIFVSIGGVCDVHPIARAISEADMIMYGNKNRGGYSETP